MPVTPGPTFIKGQAPDLFDMSQYSAQTYSQWYDVSRDGTRFLMQRIVGRPRPEPVVVCNFLEELKGVVSGGRL